MTTTKNWRPFQVFDGSRLSAARLQAHFAAQWLARAARANIEPREDDSHANFGWDATFEGFATHPLGGDVRLALRIRDLTFSLIDAASNPLATQPLDGLADPQTGERLASLLARFNLELDPHTTPLPYAMPASPLASGAAYRPGDHAAELAELSAWFANANLSLEGVLPLATSRGFAPAPPRCWPHHFDLATLTAFPVRRDGSVAYVGAGLSPGDGYYDEPYFYVSIYPRPTADVLPALPAGAHWREQDFFAAVAGAHEILGRERPQAETEAYLVAAIEFAFGAFA